MKKYRILIVFMAFFAGVICTVNAQAPYKNGIGVSVGNMQALTFKTFGGNHFAFQLDLGTKFITTNGHFKNLDLTGVSFWTLELNPNFMYECQLASGLYGLVGLGASIGYDWNFMPLFHLWNRSSDYGKCGANGIFGLEYKFNAPVAMQFDFRPGYGCVFAKNYDAHYFDWSVNLGVRYTF